MKILGIDYGEKRVGVALSDVDGRIAFPKRVFQNHKGLVAEIAGFAKEEGAGRIIIGESKDFKGQDNPIMARTKAFAKELSEATGLDVEFELEFLTSHQAVQLQGKNDMLDASAAAIILQSYLDRYHTYTGTD
jgi:putative holliday junction resolvase